MAPLAPSPASGLALAGTSGGPPPERGRVRPSGQDLELPIELDQCREQPPQPMLLRQSYVARPGASRSEQERRVLARARAIRYRTEQYGCFPGFVSCAPEPHPPSHYARLTTFMGLPVVMHRKVIPALRCVELALRRDCADHPYRPERLSGLRAHNTYLDYEVSNHVYGIAIDIDPHRNTCCGCVGRYGRHPLCSKEVASVFERMAMPECWVRVFERYGFYWLGHDELKDTMHFEFLGDPDQILNRTGNEPGPSRAEQSR